MTFLSMLTRIRIADLACKEDFIKRHKITTSVILIYTFLEEINF